MITHCSELGSCGGRVEVHWSSLKSWHMICSLLWSLIQRFWFLTSCSGTVVNLNFVLNVKEQ